MATRIFKPKVPKDRDAGVSQDGDGKFRVDVRFRREGGELFRKQVRGIDTKTEARKRRDEFYEEFNVLEGGNAYAERLVVVEVAEDRGPTVGSWCDECVSIHWPRTVPSTLKGYSQSTRDHIKPTLGEIPLADLTGRRIVDWVFELKDKSVVLNPKSKTPQTIKLGVSSLKAAKAALSPALSLAVDEGYIASNPALGLRIKWATIEEERRREKRMGAQSEGEDAGEDIPDKRLLTKAEVDRLLAASKGTRIYPTLLLQARCGLRIAEALAVRPRDIDLKAGILKVRRQLKWVKVEGRDRLMTVELKDSIVPSRHSSASIGTRVCTGGRIAREALHPERGGRLPRSTAGADSRVVRLSKRAALRRAGAAEPDQPQPALLLDEPSPERPTPARDRR